MKILLTVIVVLMGAIVWQMNELLQPVRGPELSYEQQTEAAIAKARRAMNEYLCADEKAKHPFAPVSDECRYVERIETYGN